MGAGDESESGVESFSLFFLRKNDATCSHTGRGEALALGGHPRVASSYTPKAEEISHCSIKRESISSLVISKGNPSLPL